MQIEDSFQLELPRFVGDYPDEQNGFRLRSGTWKYDFENRSMDEIRQMFLTTRRFLPKRSSELFPGFEDFRILECGPAEGYNTVHLQELCKNEVVSIEANADAFLRCLILKNALGLNAKFLLGDFVKYVASGQESYDLIYASGVLYHLLDPVQFILDCGKVSNHLFLWSMYYDREAVENTPYERARFHGSGEMSFEGEAFTYYTRFVDPASPQKPTYQGAINDRANWLTLDDIRRAINLAGYEIVHEIGDGVGTMKAMSFWASKPS